ncbi:CheR family methyltransferase [Arcticibacter eurypsychrophilus]|uniref:CheR family methyltransferase n=1 Tax=Arcticibacter eurypsychrophilus TaxID=1434752 RepID=UPI00084DCB0C|nr:protein-glutamate O-methyltransferase CheR [Arcticibacter eurypsychrophilus]
MMSKDVTEQISYPELEELIQWVNWIHGFDFSGYSRASLKRRVTRMLHFYHLSLYDLKALLVNDHDFFEEFIVQITVNVTEMFRDPLFYEALREKVVPYLASYQRVKVWNAGCSTGEELYSFAILLKLEGFLDRSFLYGTDINPQVLEQAKKAIYNLSDMKSYSENYHSVGFPGSLADFYVAQYDAAAISNELKKNTLFSVHNLVSDAVFNEFQVISCRNVLIYFNLELQARVIKLFYDSLCPFGFLCLGSKETLRGAEIRDRFRVIDRIGNIYQKIE